MVQASVPQSPEIPTPGAARVRPLLIIKAGETLESLRHDRGDFVDWFAAGLNSGDAVDRPVRVFDPRTDSPWPSQDEVAGVVVTGSHSMVTDREPWSERTAAWLSTVVEAQVPVLGICYGHQLLADALGGQAGNHPTGMELGTVEVTTTAQAAQDPLFADMPDRFEAHVIHRQSALQLPAQAVALAGNAFEPNQAFRVGANAWGLQFHPEFDEAAMHGYVAHVAKQSTDAPSDVRVGPTPHAASLLPRFARIVDEAERSRRNPREIPA